MPTTVETVIAFYAINRLGAVADMLDPRSNKEQLKFYLKENESKVLILFDACYSKIKDILSETNIQQVILASAADSMPAILKIIYHIKNCKGQNKVEQDNLFITWKKFAQSKAEECKIADYEKICLRCWFTQAAR